MEMITVATKQRFLFSNPVYGADPTMPEIILGMGSVNKKRRYNVRRLSLAESMPRMTLPLLGWWRTGGSRLDISL